jgi:hypothetical protein
MFDPFTLALIGAGVGGGLSLLRGNDVGNSLKNAAIGGGLGYAGGTYLPSAFGATPATATSASTAANTGGNYLAATEAPVGMFNTFNPATGAPLANTSASIVGSTGEIAPNLGLVNPMSSGVQDYSPLMTRMGQGTSYGGLSATTSAEAMDSPFMTRLKGLGEYVTPQNMLGVATLLDQQSQAPQMSSVGGGGVRGGNAQTGEGVEEFLRRMGARVQSPQRRQGLFY